MSEEVLENDYKRNLRDYVRSRFVLRKCAEVADFIGNALLYLGSCTSSVASTVHLIIRDVPTAQYTSNLLLFVSTGLFAFHVTMISFAKYTVKEEVEKEQQLRELANVIGFQVIPLTPSVTENPMNP